MFCSLFHINQISKSNVEVRCCHVGDAGDCPSTPLHCFHWTLPSTIATRQFKNKTHALILNLESSCRHVPLSLLSSSLAAPALACSGLCGSARRTDIDPIIRQSPDLSRPRKSVSSYIFASISATSAPASMAATSGRASMATLGAVENLIDRSSHIQLADGTVVELVSEFRQYILQRLEGMTSEALCTFGFAYKEDLGEFSTYDGEEHFAYKRLLDPANYSSIESNLVFSGFVALRDPPRQEVHKAINDCKDAGIRVLVITGDNKSTAEDICHEIGVFEASEDIRNRSFTGKDFMALSVSERQKVLKAPGGLLFSISEPRHKQDIVRTLKDAGEVVAMTGDGVNDAAALKLADIGIAMGIAGTERLQKKQLIWFWQRITSAP